MEKKVFRFIGYIKKGSLKMKFKKEILDVKLEGALEKLYSILGSNHKVKRKQIVIEKVEEVPPEKAEDQFIRQFVQLVKEGRF